eukprot:scaffold14468_cov19-Tisochrysis_lutea.AAC.2
MASHGLPKRASLSLEQTQGATGWCAHEPDSSLPTPHTESDQTIAVTKEVINLFAVCPACCHLARQAEAQVTKPKSSMSSLPLAQRAFQLFAYYGGRFAPVQLVKGHWKGHPR